ncbi:unnamed protein product [Caenorhabditis brenneri]
MISASELTAFILGSLDVQEELSIRHSLEEIPDQLIPLKKYDPKASPYAAPQVALNDRMFASVEEYPDGYTGYHCSIIGNFRYTLELCSKHVWECTDGKLSKKTCPGNSVFWFSEGICEMLFEPTCKYQGNNTRGANWPLNLIHAARVINGTFDPIMITTDCTKVKSGFFAIKECFSEYIVCSSGILLSTTCHRKGPNMVFDERIRRCVSMEECKAPLEGNPKQNPIQPWDDKPETIDFRLRLPVFQPFLITTDCRRRRYSDNYEIGRCHQNHLGCNDGKWSILSCPIGLVYSSRKEKYCVDLKECEETWGPWKEDFVRPSFKIRSRHVPEPKKPLSFWRRPEEIVLVPTVEECVGKKNGGYAMSPCQSEYMYCYMESGFLVKCSEGSVFSRRFMECVGKEFCQE